jgi:hypothetical protein
MEKTKARGNELLKTYKKPVPPVTFSLMGRVGAGKRAGVAGLTKLRTAATPEMSSRALPHFPL